jgi:hypothetical protein
MRSNDRLPSGITVVTEDLATLVVILDRLAPDFVEPGPRVLKQWDGVWTRMVLVPPRWCIREHQPIAHEVQEAAALAYSIGAIEVYGVSFELTLRPLRRLLPVASQDVNGAPVST